MYRLALSSMPRIPVPKPRTPPGTTLALSKTGAFQPPPPSIMPQSIVKARLGTVKPRRVEAAHPNYGTAAVWEHGRLIRKQKRGLRREVALEGFEPSTAAVTTIAAGARLAMCAYFNGTPPMRLFREELARSAMVRVLEDAGVSCICEHEPAGYLRQENGYPAYGKIDIYVPSEGAD